MLDSSRPEPFVALCPHRLPLPPLLASQTPLDAGKSSSRPFGRKQLQPLPCLTAVDPPLLQSVKEKKTLVDPHDILAQPKLNMADLINLAQACQRSQRPLAEALAYWNAAIEHENAGLHVIAQSFFEKFIAPCRRAQYTPGVVTGLSSISASLFLQGNYKESVQTCEQALQLLDETTEVVQKTSGGWLTSNYLAASLLLNIGLSFLQLFDYEAATLAFARALQHALQTQDKNCEGAICASQAICNALSGDFQKVDSCLDRYIEITQIQETGLETTLGLKSLKLVQQNQVSQTLSDSVRQATLNACVCFLRIGAMARVHGDFQRARHFCQRAYNVGIVYGFQKCAVQAGVSVGVCEAEIDDIEAGQNGDIKEIVEFWEVE
ncbi:Tetratricopeptide repeat-containing protein [Spironucleus salmonicida]|uniref:Tetratricopeptide repeat-containing protein n=1 Tax=Spironucleus salmonicida TaxID=348837 RepID=V6LZ03_9EUKA|nr:Tetratricopeptide repeat-containing protein [Spironucleus salmonicida]|eukprot:EST46064.1 hypothetical protein SS50377_14054 [Spironucleus salmonicida]